MTNKVKLTKKKLECIAEAEQKFGSFLKETGQSFTKSRKEAIKVIYSFDGHFDLEELKERFVDMEVSFHFTSIFRLINLLLEAGMLEKIKTNAHRKVAYECTLCRQHHDHLVCNHCGEIIEFHNSEIERLQKKVAKEHDFEILYHNLTITGNCSNCQNRKKHHRRTSPSNVVKSIN